MIIIVVIIVWIIGTIICMSEDMDVLQKQIDRIWNELARLNGGKK